MVSKILRADGVTELASIQSVTYHESVNADTDLRPGCVASSYIEVTCFGAQSDAPDVGEALTYYQVVGETETLIGIFFAEPSIPTKNSYKFVAYDAVHKLDAYVSSWLSAHQEDFPYTVYQLVSQACTIAGVTLGSSSWLNSSMSVNAFYADGLTCRNILQYAAEIGCKFVRCHADGKVYFDWYTTASNQRIYPSSGTSGSETRYAYKQDGLNYENYNTTAIARVAIHPVGEDEVAYYYPTNVTSGNTLNITNNLMLYGQTGTSMVNIANGIYDRMAFTYRPMSVEMFPNECPFSVGQKVAVTDAQGVSFTTVIMEKTVTDSEVTLTSTGREVYGDYALDTAKQLVQLAADIVRINKLKVDWAEIGTAVIGVLNDEGITAAKLNGANQEEQLVYISKASGTTTQSKPSSWVTNTTGNQNTWTLKRPVYNSSYPVLFVATQRKAVDGTVTCTTPAIDQTTTVIDGGHITTGTIDASVANVTNIDASNINTGALTVRDASNNIIFQADASNKNVQIGGWYANKDYIYSSNSDPDINSLYIGRGQIIFKDPNGNAKKDIVIDASKEYVSGKWQNRIDTALYNVYEGDSSIGSDYSIGCVINDLFAPHFSIGSHFDGSNITSDIYFDADTVTIMNPSAWRTAIGAVNKAGDTMSGYLAIAKSGMADIYLKNTAITIGTAPSSDLGSGLVAFRDSGNRNLAHIYQYYTTAKMSYIRMIVYNYVGNTEHNNFFDLRVNADGTPAVFISQPNAWREALSVINPLKIGYYGSDNADTAGWYRVITVSQSGYSDNNLNLLITSGYGRRAVGILCIHTRCDNNNVISCQCLRWLARFGFGVGDVAFKDNGNNTWSLYVYQSVDRYGRIQVQILTETGTSQTQYNFTLNTPNNTKESSLTGTTLSTEYLATVNDKMLISSVKSISNNTWTQLGSGITLDAGTWVVFVSCRFAANATGRRGLAFTTSQPTTRPGVRNGTVIGASPNEQTILEHSTIFRFSSATTYYAYALQQSGGNLNVEDAGIRYIRLCD